MRSFAVADSGLFPEIQSYLTGLVSSLDESPAPHAAGCETLAKWIAAAYQRGTALPLIAVCTGNSRRSVLMSTLWSMAANYCGLPEIRGYSGGTHPSAVNSRTIQALQAIGVEIAPLGAAATPGAEGLPNPQYRFRWGRLPSGAFLETAEFSKSYHDQTNPQTGFAALMVCDEADLGCPVVAGASIRVSLPFVDPKSRDGSPDEVTAYAACRDAAGRFVLATLLVARRLIDGDHLP